LSFYVQKFFVPYPLAADYGRTREIALAGDVWIYGLVVVALLAVLVGVFWKRLSKRYLYFAGLFVLLLSPILGVIPFHAQAQSTVSDRYAYFPVLGLGLMVGTFV